MEQKYKRVENLDTMIKDISLPYIEWKVLFLTAEDTSQDELSELIKENNQEIASALNSLEEKGLIELAEGAAEAESLQEEAPSEERVEADQEIREVVSEDFAQLEEEVEETAEKTEQETEEEMEREAEQEALEIEEGAQEETLDITSEIKEESEDFDEVAEEDEDRSQRPDGRQDVRGHPGRHMRSQPLQGRTLQGAQQDVVDPLVGLGLGHETPPGLGIRDSTRGHGQKRRDRQWHYTSGQAERQFAGPVGRRSVPW